MPCMLHVCGLVIFPIRNNNGGGVNKSGRGMTMEGGAGGMGAIAEDEEEDGDRGRAQAGATGDADVNNVPQAFSHFSYVVTCGQKLVCDLQVGGQSTSNARCMGGRGGPSG